MKIAPKLALSCRPVFWLAPLIGLGLTSLAQAQELRTWDGAADLDWTNAGNWTTGVNPGVPDGNDTVNLAGPGGVLSNVYSGFASQHRLFFNSGAGAYTLNGPAAVTFFDFGGAAPKIENNSVNLQTINFGVIMDGSGSANVAEINPVDGDLLFNGSVGIAGSTQLRVWGNNGKTLTFAGAVTGSATNELALNQNSNVIFRGANTYSGLTLINAGNLDVQAGTQASAVKLGNTSGTDSAKLTISGLASNWAGATLSTAVEVRAGTSGNTLTISGGPNVTGTAGGAITLNNAVTLNGGGGQLKLNGIITGTNQPITVTGSGMTVLSGANTYTGQLTVKSGATLGTTTVGTVGTSGSLGAGGAGNETIVESGGTILLGGAQYGGLLGGATNAEIFKIAGTGTSGQGAIVNTLTGGQNNFNKIVLTADATLSAGGGNQTSFGSGGNIITGNGRTDIRIATPAVAAAANLDLAGFTLTKTGNQLLSLVNADVSSGNINVDAGQLSFEVGTLVNGTGTITVNPKGKLGFYSIAAAGNITRQIVVNGGTVGDVVASAVGQTIGSPIQFTGAANPNFVANGAQTTTLSGLITQSSFTGTALDKRGAGGGALIFNNPANSFSAPINIYAGTLRGDYTTAVAGGVIPGASATTTDTPLGTGNAVNILGGTLSIRANMANDATNQRLSLPTAVTVDRAPGAITFDRIANATQTDKYLTFASITTAGRTAANGYSIGQNQLTFTQANTHRLEFNNLSLGGDVNLVNGDFNITGNVISAGGNTLQKTGGSSWGTNTGGLTHQFNAVVVTGNTATRVGSMYGTPDVSNTATLGSGPIYLGPNNVITFRSPTNIASGQIIDLRSQDQTQSTVQLEAAFTSVPANLRAPESGVLAINGASGITNIDLSRIGDGTFRLASGFAAIGGTNTYAGTIGNTVNGVGGVVRIAGGGTTTFSAANAFSGGTVLDVGSPLFNGGFRTNFNGVAENGTAILTAANNYTGGTTINRTSVLNLQVNNAVGTGPVSNYGSLTLSTATGVLPAANTLSMYGGSTLTLDNSAITTAGLNVDRVSSAALTMNASTITMNSRNVAAADVTAETIGALTINGGNVVNLNRTNTATSGHNVELTSTGSTITRNGTATLEVTRNTGTGAGFGVGQKLILTGGTASPFVGGHIVGQNGSQSDFMALNATTGLISITYSSTVAAGTFTTGLAATSFVNMTGATTLGDNPVIGLLRTAGAITTATGFTNITLRQGGVTFDTTATQGNNWIFNNGTADIEGFMYSRSGVTTTLSGTVQANGLTKFGGGTQVMSVASPLLVGNVSINQGILQSHGPAATGTLNTLGTGQIILGGGQLNLRSNNTAVTGTINQTLQNTGITLLANVPFATVDVNRSGADTASVGTFIINPAAAGGAGLVLQGSPGVQGQTFTLTGANYALQFGNNANNSIAGNATINLGVNLTLNNGPTITGTNPVITKAGSGGTWIVGANVGSPSVAAGTKVVLNAGILELRSVTAFGTATTTSLELNGGTLNLRRDSAGTYGNLSGPGYPVTVNGNSTISVDRVSAGSSLQLGLGALTLKNDALLTVNQGNTFGLTLDSLKINGNGLLSANIAAGTQDTAVRVTGNATGGSLVKLGVGHMHLLGANSTYDGGTFINGGYLRLRAAGAAGTGTVVLNPSATLDLNASNNLNVGQNVIVRSGSAIRAMISRNTDGAFPTANIDTTEAAEGIVGLSNGSAGIFNTAIDLGALYGGKWSLGGVSQGAYDPRYTATTLGVGSGNLYRLGGGGTSFFLGLDSANAPIANVLTGASNSVRLGFDSGNLYISATTATLGNFQFVLGGANDFGGSTVIHRGIAARSTAAVVGGKSAFSTGAVDVFGALILTSNGTLQSSGLATNALTLHPGSSLTIDNFASANGTAVNLTDRVADGQALNITGSTIDFLGANTLASTETLGAITYGAGSRIRAALQGTGGTTALTLTSLASSGAGSSLLLQASAAATLGTTNKIIVSGLGNVAMMDPRIVNMTDGSFVGHDATNGFVNLTSNIVTVNAGGVLAAGLPFTTNLDVRGAAATATSTLGDNMTINSLRTDQNISLGGPFTNITLRSGGLMSAANTVTVQPNLIFNDGTSNIEARISAISTMVLQGQITANGVTKFGAGQLFVRVPQPNYASGWNINNGDIIFDDPGAAGQSVPGNIITINGSTSTVGATAAAGFGTTLGATTGVNSRVVFRFDNQSPEEIAFTGGGIVVNNEGQIQVSYANTAGAAANDRRGVIPSVTVNSDSALSGAGISFDLPNSRNRTRTPSLTLNSNTTLRIIDGGSPNDYGRVVSLAVDSLVGTGKSLIKMGNRTLELTSDNSSTFTGGSITIGQGSVVVRHNGALGSATTTATIERNATLEIGGGAANYTPVGTVVQQPGSSERWMIQDARGTSYSLPAGVNLQLGANLQTARTITLNGGTIEAFGYTDDVNNAFQRDISSNVTLNLTGNSYLGQAVYLQGQHYDTGRQPNVNAPFAETFQGGILNIAGAITGAFDLTKTGLDTVRISGTSNTYNDTKVDMGVVQLGADNALPTTKALVTRNGGIFDMYGFNQTVGKLGTSAGYTDGGVSVLSSGKITNSGAVDLKILTVDQSVDSTYNGIIEQNVSLTKKGAGSVALGGSNTYRGTTSIEGGTLLLASDTALSPVTNVTLSGGKLSTGGFDGTTSGSLSLSANSVIDFGNTTSILTFANNTTGTWTGLLSIWNWDGAVWASSSGGAEKLNFLSSTLTAPQLASIQFYSGNGTGPIGTGADFLSGANGELVPVPEPTAALGALLLLGTLGYRERRRLLHFRE